MLSLEERKLLIEKIPWVTRLKTNRLRCQAITSKAPLSAYREGYTEKYRCARLAHWRFRALKSSFARSGEYCLVHLISHCLYSGTELDRLRAWQEKEVDSGTD